MALRWRPSGRAVGLLVAALVGTSVGLTAADAGIVRRAAAAVPSSGVALIPVVGGLSARHLVVTALVVGAVGTLGARTPRGEETTTVRWWYAVVAVLVATLAGAVAAEGALARLLVTGYAALAAIYLVEAWLGANRYPAPRVARWLLVVSGVAPALLVGFREQYATTALAPLYGRVGGVPTLAVVLALPAATLAALASAAVLEGRSAGRG